MSSHFDVYSTKSLLHNHSQSQTIQVLELEIENNFRMDLDVASNNLDDRSFSHLKEIRLLFESFIEISSPRRTLPPPQSKRKCTGKYCNWILHAGVGVRGIPALQYDAPEFELRFVTEEAVSLFKSYYALKASAKGGPNHLWFIEWAGWFIVIELLLLTQILIQSVEGWIKLMYAATSDWLCSLTRN